MGEGRYSTSLSCSEPQGYVRGEGGAGSGAATQIAKEGTGGYKRFASRRCVL